MGRNSRRAHEDDEQPTQTRQHVVLVQSPRTGLRTLEDVGGIIPRNPFGQAANRLVRRGLFCFENYTQ